MLDYNNSKQVLRFTNTLGVELSIPLVGALEGGLAMNATEFGLYSLAGRRRNGVTLVNSVAKLN